MGAEAAGNTAKYSPIFAEARNFEGFGRAIFLYAAARRASGAESPSSFGAEVRASLAASKSPFSSSGISATTDAFDSIGAESADGNDTG